MVQWHTISHDGRVFVSDSAALAPRVVTRDALSRGRGFKSGAIFTNFTETNHNKLDFSDEVRHARARVLAHVMNAVKCERSKQARRMLSR